MTEVLDLNKDFTKENQNVDKSKNRKRRRKKEPGTGSTPNATVPLPPCKVCGGNSTGYHFGAITCEACKAFFRRVLIHKHEYKCMKNDDCKIVMKRLGNCSACRLKKCYDIGMSKGGVRKGRYSIAIRTRAIVEAKALEGKNPPAITPSKEACEMSAVGNSSKSSIESALSSSTESLLRNTDDNSTTTQASNELSSSNSPDLQFRPNVELELLIDALVGCQDAVYPNIARQFEKSKILQAQRQIFEDSKDKEEFFGKMFGTAKDVTTKDYQQIFAETGIDLDDRMAHFNAKGKSMEEEIAQYVNFTKIIPGFKSLNPKDVSNLLKASHCEFWLLGNYMLFNNELGTAISWNGTFNTTMKTIEKFWSPEWVKLVFKLADMIQKLELSLEEIVLIRVIILTYTDRCKLKDREKIQILQEKFLDCLNYQLMKSRKDYNRYVYKIFDILLRLRDLTELNFKVNQKFLQEWGFAIHEFPLWKEIVSYENDV